MVNAAGSLCVLHPALCYTRAEVVAGAGWSKEPQRSGCQGLR